MIKFIIEEFSLEQSTYLFPSVYYNKHLHLKYITAIECKCIYYVVHICTLI